MAIASNLGFPRIGAHRELKFAQEKFWKKESTAEELLATGKELRERHWRLQAEAGIDQVPTGDFSFYDTTLDMIALTGAVPQRYGHPGGEVSLDTYFTMARGAENVVAMEMTKWFDTNYHYIVPEFHADQQFRLSGSKPLDEFLEAKALGLNPRPVILGPVSFLLLGKMRDHSDRWALLDRLLPVYEQLLEELAAAGAEWVQIDEPCLVTDLDQPSKVAYQASYNALSSATSDLKILLATYFGGLRDNLSLVAALPVAGLHIDLVRAPDQLDEVLAALPETTTLSLGLIDGRNIWKTDLARAEALANKAAAKRGGDRLMIAGSCSLLHSPVDLANETSLDAETKSWLAFATQKLGEISALAAAVGGDKDAAFFEANAEAVATRRTSERIHDVWIKERMSGLKPEMSRRQSAFPSRIAQQQAELKLPLLPTTTIGSYPQTADVREARAKFKRGEMNEAGYEAYLEEKTADVMRWQDEIGIDVPVHGEFERNDMVEYFGEQLSGFTFTQNGWVQSYGSRCVKPPVIFGDVSRPEPMTVKWSVFAQSKTTRPVKGMLTGPVTILQWSFVRDDQPRADTCRQIALAIRDEVSDLEEAGIRVIQIDEPALREGLPLRRADWQAYLDWAVDSFKLSSCSVADGTQIHTHMCYSEFNDIIEAIAALDADVISIETSRSAMELLDAFVNFKYPNDIGPGVYDIHSPRVPNQEEMTRLLEKALQVLSPEQIWVNPDCGLKTRGWAEVKPALEAMVASARALREQIGKQRIAASA